MVTGIAVNFRRTGVFQVSLSILEESFVALSPIVVS